MILVSYKNVIAYKGLLESVIEAEIVIQELFWQGVVRHSGHVGGRQASGSRSRPMSLFWQGVVMHRVT